MSLVIIQHFVICLFLMYPTSHGACEEALDECPSIKTILNTLLSFEKGLHDSTENELNELLEEFPCYEPKGNDDICMTFGSKKLTQIIYRLLALCNELRYTRKRRIEFVSAAKPKWQNLRVKATLPKIISLEGVCKEGWSYHNKCCYKMIVGGYSFFTAREACKGFGADLASLPDKLERKFVNDLSGGKIYWIGGVRSHGKQYNWLTGEPIDNPSWRHGEPNGCCPNPADCILVNYRGKDGGWGDSGCSVIHRNYNSVCKYCPK